MFRVAVGECRELDGKRVIVGGQLEPVSRNDGCIADLIAVGLRRAINWSTVDDERHEFDLGIPFCLFDEFRMEPSDTANAAEEHETEVGCIKSTWGTVRELIRLQAIVDKITFRESCLWVQAAKTMIGGYP